MVKYIKIIILLINNDIKVKNFSVFATLRSKYINKCLLITLNNT